MMKKRTLALLLSLALCIPLAACGGGDNSGSNDSGNTNNGGSTQTDNSGNSNDGNSAPASTPITIKVQGAFPEGAEVYFYLDQFAQSVSERSNGSVTIVWGSGPEAIPTDQLAEAMQNGIVEMVISPCTYLVTHAPGLRGVKLTDPAEMRTNGGTEYLNSLVSDTLNCQWLAYTSVDSFYTLSSTKEIQSLDDFQGMVIRGTAAHKPVLVSVGAEMTSMGWGDIYSALERGVIDGCGGTLKDYVDNGLADKLGYVIQPGFFQNDGSIFIANHIWNKLDDVQKQALIDSAKDWEDAASAYYTASNEENLAKLEEGGATILTFEGQMLEDFLKGAYDAAWAEVEADAPEVAEQLRSFTSN